MIKNFQENYIMENFLIFQVVLRD